MRKTTGIATAAILALGGAGVASADVIDIVSEAGDPCTYEAGSGLTGTCITHVIEPHPAWQSNNPTPPGYGGVWVSYADTGVDGETLAPTSSDPIFSIVESFTIGSSGSLDFWIWADDTADVFFNLSGDGLDLQFGANFSQDTCADGPIGCESNEYYNLTRNLALGSYDITMNVYQVGTGSSPQSNPFGVLYSGRVSTVAEPGTLALLGLGLIGVGAARRRKA